MGAPMAARLLAAGFDVTVYNRDIAKTANLVASGARLAESPQELARDVDIVVTVLFDDDAVEAIAFGKNGLVECMQPDSIHLSCSTISPALADRLEAAHRENSQYCVSAPLLGSATMAEAGTLYLATSGPAAAIQRLQLVFAAIAQQVKIVGDRPRHAAVAKLANNFLIFALTEAMAEATVLAERAGLSRSTMMELLWETDFGKRIFSVYGRKIIERSFEPPTAPTRLAVKDIELAIETARATGASVPLAQFLIKRLEDTTRYGWGELDFAAVTLLAEAESER